MHGLGAMQTSTGRSKSQLLMAFVGAYGGLISHADRTGRRMVCEMRKTDTTRGNVLVKSKRARMPNDEALKDFLAEMAEHQVWSKSKLDKLLETAGGVGRLERLRKRMQREKGGQVEEEEVAMKLGISVDELEKRKKDMLKARDEVVQGNLRLVVWVANKMYRAGGMDGIGVSKADLVQEGCIALIRAAELFDVQRGGVDTWGSYAFKAVWRKCRRENRPVGCLVHVPERMRKKVEMMRQGDEMNIDVQKAKLALEKGVWLDEKEWELADDLDNDDIKVREQVLEACRRCLSTRDADIMRMKFGLDGNPPRIAREIGEMVGVSAARVGQIVGGAVNKLRTCESGLSELWANL